MTRAPQTLAGRLLVSHPQLRDDHFRETVVLLHTHDAAEGALGVIVNRPLRRVLGQINPLFPALQSGRRLPQRLSPQKQFLSS